MVSHAGTLLSSQLPDPFDSFHWGWVVDQLASAVEEAGNMPVTVTEEQKRIAHGAVGTFVLTAGAIGVPYSGDASTPPAGTRAAELIFSRATTVSVVAAAEARNISITAAVHATLAAVNFRQAILKHQVPLH
ncbi:uncharacterized protein BDW43DRAFT_294739 [Aspergillus alliaceus]|uniref:uncharacterized protein n=1 Tax=Petromyces alliaceus TaxID=209559 RepID=UPI0012A71416|nr:uncharacterized protein BDW43DRAFT_294739 [Aspergillus alliaceus]KAB8227157.1 hypothetical protein BDW43DRAFT_294739 [Aspergillus alliaceus]